MSVLTWSYPPTIARGQPPGRVRFAAWKSALRDLAVKAGRQRSSATTVVTAGCSSPPDRTRRAPRCELSAQPGKAAAAGRSCTSETPGRARSPLLTAPHSGPPLPFCSQSWTHHLGPCQQREGQKGLSRCHREARHRARDVKLASHCAMTGLPGRQGEQSLASGHGARRFVAVANKGSLDA
jgi:hypothetical protein